MKILAFLVLGNSELELSSRNCGFLGIKNPNSNESLNADQMLANYFRSYSADLLSEA
jgi:hypothetical protein